MSDYEIEELDEIKTSKINSAGLNNLRMHEIWIDANKHKRSGEFSKWNGDLDAMWCELVGDVKDNDDNDKKFNNINQALGKTGSTLNYNLTRDGFNQVDDKEILNKTKQYLLLIKKESFLRRLQNEQGKGTAYQD